METNSRNQVAITLLPIPGDEVNYIFASEEEFAIWKLLTTKFPGSAKAPSGQFEIFYKLHLAAFIDIDTHPLADKGFILKTVVTFLVCKRGSNGAGHSPLLVIISASNPAASEIRSVLKVTNIAVLAYKSSDSSGDFAEVLDLALAKPAFIPHKEALKFTTLLVNKSEFNLRVLVKEALDLYLSPKTRDRLKDVKQHQDFRERIKKAKDLVAVFQEVAVCEVIQQERTRRIELERYRQTARFDLLVTTAPPYAQPRLALEFDGPCHQTPEGKRKDALKNELCIAAGLPLVRVNFERWNVDTVIVPGDEANLLHEELANRMYKRFVWTVVRHIKEEIELCTGEKYEEAKLSAIQMENAIARSLELKLGEKYKKLDAEARRNLIEYEMSLSGLYPMEYLEYWSDDASYLSPQSWWPHSWIGSLLEKSISSLNGIVKDPRILCQRGCWSGSLQLILPDRKEQKCISTPPLEFTAFGVPEEWLNNMIKSFLASWLLESAISILRARQAK
jgi:hypothetical protein